MTSPLSSFPDRSKNRLLNALPHDEYKELFTNLERVSLSPGQVLIRPGEPIQYLYFPEDAVLGHVAIMMNGAGIELSSIGQEGLVGEAAMLGDGIVAYQVLVNIAGTAQRAGIDMIKNEFRGGGILHDLILRYVQAMVIHMIQVSACNRHHHLRERLVRMLLIMRDQVGANALLITQERLAFKLGTHRPDITKVISGLQRARKVSYRRGQLTIQDRAGLEQESCECYSVIRDTYTRLFPSMQAEQ